MANPDIIVKYGNVCTVEIGSSVIEYTLILRAWFDTAY